MRIPTILGLFIIILFITGGIGFLTYKQQLEKADLSLYHPMDIKTANVTDNSLTITWQTQQPAAGEVVFGDTSNLSQTALDIRDKDKPSSRHTHFVTLTNLKPNTVYYYQIKSQGALFPAKPLEVKTSSQLTITDRSLLEQKQPLYGNINLTPEQPADEALVFLNIEGAATVATFTRENGSFILPLKDLRTKDLQNFYKINNSTSAYLTAQKGGLKSDVKLTLPINGQPIPVITLGQNLDLTGYFPKSSAEKSLSFDDPSNPSSFDLNNDQRVNSLDLAVVIDNIGKRVTDKKIDINKDGKIDSIDAEIIRSSL